MDETQLTVTGLSCEGCEEAVTDALEALEGIERASADRETDTVVVTARGQISTDTVRDAVASAGYTLEE